MPSYKQSVSDPLSPLDRSSSGAAGHFNATVCKTRNLVDNFYQCQISRADCEHSFTFGMSYLCKSPDCHEYSEPS